MSQDDQNYNPVRGQKTTVKSQSSESFDDLVDKGSKKSFKFKLPVSKKKLYLLAGLVVVLLAGFGVYGIFFNNDDTQVNDETSVLSETIELDQEAQSNEEPEFDVVIPKNSSESTQRYDPEREVVQYVDEYKGQSVRITQQPLPSELKDDPDQLEAIASSIPDGVVLDKINTDLAGTVFVSRSNKRGDATVLIFQDLLIFINISQGLSVDEWNDYIQYLLT